MKASMFAKTLVTTMLFVAASLLTQSAQAQKPTSGFIRPDRTDGVNREGASRCPSRWREDNYAKGEYTEKRGFCYPQYANSPKIYLRKGGTCKAGYGVDGEWCSEGHIEHPELNNPNVIGKANKGDRCPAGFHSYLDKCTTDYARPSKARPKGKGQCKAGEIEEWGVWCTSDYDHLSVQDVRSAHYRDYNNLYAMTGGRGPNQGNHFEAASEVYTAMFGDSRLDGPVGQANSALVNKRPLTAEQRQLLANANAATAAMLPPEGAQAAAGAEDGGEGGVNDAKKAECDGIKLRGKLGQMARKAMGCS